VKNGVFLANENEYISLQNKHDVIQHLLQKATQKEKLKTKTTDAPRKTHSA
jgi:hypothetical protein